MGVNLWKRDGVWYARGRVTMPDGTSVALNRSTRVEVGPGAKRHAEAVAHRLVAEVRNGATARMRPPGHADVDPTAATVRNAVDAYCRRREVGPDFVGLLESFAHRFGAMRLLELDEAEIMAWATTGPRLRLAGRTAAPRTVQGRIKAVRALLRLAEARLQWPVPDLDLPTTAVFPKRPKWLKIEQRNALLQAIDPFWRPFAIVLFMTGARPVELGRLTWADVHAPTKHQEHSRLILRHLKGRVRGVAQWKVRDVPLTAAVWAVLPKRGRPEEFVFRDEDGLPIAEAAGAKLEVSSSARAQIGKAVKVAAQRCDVAELGVTPYWARHTFASLLMQDGVALQIVAELLGHASTKEVEGTYGHLAPHQKEWALASLGGLELG